MAETIKIAVCDDEKNIRSYLVSLIKKQGGECGRVLFSIQKTTWKAGESVNMLTRRFAFPPYQTKAKNFRADLDFQKQKICDSRSQINHSRSRR